MKTGATYARFLSVPIIFLLGAVGCSSRSTATGAEAGVSHAPDGSDGSASRRDAGTGDGATGKHDADGGHTATDARASDSATDSGVWRTADGGERAEQSDEFVDSVGANIHLTFSGTPYLDGYANFKTLLVNSGIRHFRDGLVTGDPTFASHVEELADAGVRGDLITSPTEDAGVIEALAGSLGGAMDALEAPNEYNNSGDPEWAMTLEAYLPTLDHATSSPGLADVPVVGPSLTTESAYGSIGDGSSEVTVGNVHVYFSGFMPETPGWGATDMFGTYGSIPYDLAIAGQAFGHLPIWMTEMGIGTEPSTHGQVPLDVQGKYVPRALFEAFRLGVPRTYIYQFMDQGGVADGFGYYGLVSVDPSDLTGNVTPFVPKPAYVALSAILAELADPGAGFSPGALSLGLSGQGDSLHHVLLEKRDQTFVLVFWLASPDWNPNLPTDTGPGGYVTVSPQGFSISVGQPVSRARLISFDASTGVKSVTMLDGSSGSLSLTATDTVQLLELRP